MRGTRVLMVLGVCLPLQLLQAQTFDAAKAFGARPSITSIALSPDGSRIAYVAPGDGPGSRVFAVDLVKKTRASLVMSTDGKPLRITSCDWVTNDRLICRLFGVVRDARIGLAPVYRLIAVNADGTNLKVLSNLRGDAGYLVRQDGIIDWLPDGSVLMMRQYAHNAHDHFNNDQQGMGVDLIDTSTLSVKQVEPPQRNVAGYITDGRGNVRIMGFIARDNRGVDKGLITFEYRTPGSKQWQQLSEYNQIAGDGFQPERVDPTLNVVYGFRKQNGRRAVYSVSLDGALHEELVYAKPDVDMDGLIQIGRRVVGVSYITDKRHEHFFAPEIGELFQSLHEAIPQPTLRFVESSGDPDHNTMLFFARGDTDPGVYYIFDRKTKRLDTFLAARGELEGVKLAGGQSISYPAADGTRVSAYLTLPPGQEPEQAKGLPAVVLPPGAANGDTTTFDWQAQFLVSRGYAVLRLERYGATSGFHNWNTAVDDINSGARWLVSQGIADPHRLAVMGWLYGGYAALQSAVVDPDLFKAIVAIAPITDLSQYKDEPYGWSYAARRKESVGSGPNMHAGSPIEHVDRITAAVLLFHGELDRDVSVEESKHLAARLTAAGKSCKLVTWQDLDDDLADSSARAEMLRTSDEFIRQRLGPGSGPAAQP